jgi:hypothetical protein
MNPVLKGSLIIIALVGGITVLRFKPWQKSRSDAGVISNATTTTEGRQRLVVGYLPVT